MGDNRVFFFEDLEQMAAFECDDPACDHTQHQILWAESGHQARLSVRYRPGTGVLEVLCQHCGGLVLAVPVRRKGVSK